MSAKRIMPKGGRKASPTLWAMVRGLTEEEWQLVSIIAVIRFKETLQFKLLTLLRSMEVYDPVAEKAAFAENDLGSMRKTARRWLIRTASKLTFYQSEVALHVMDVDVLLRWGIHDETMEIIAEAKQFAKRQEDFGWLALLYKKELKAASIIFQGAERVKITGEITREAMENGKLVALDAEIDHYTAIFLEKGKNQLLTSGKFDADLATTYFSSNFYRQKIEEWPISFQIQKLRIDEAIHYYMGDSDQAAMAAERLLELYKRIETIRQIRSEDDAKCMFRLSNYYSELGNKLKVLEVISTFRVLAKSDSTFNFTYLRRFAYTLLNASMVFSLPELANEGIQSWHAQRGIIDAMPKDALRFETMIYVCAHHLSVGNVLEAREVLNQALEIAPHFPYLTWQVVLKILHLMVLLDENDERGLLSFGKNYKRHLRATLKTEPGSTVALAGLEVVMILAKESNLEGHEKLQGSARKLLERLLEFEQMEEITLKPWSYAMKNWAGLQLKK